jgi:hypothetical protein
MLLSAETLSKEQDAAVLSAETLLEEQDAAKC